MKTITSKSKQLLAGWAAALALLSLNAPPAVAQTSDFDFSLKPLDVDAAIELTFAARGDATTVETVEVENLTRGVSVSLKGTDILVLKEPSAGVQTVENAIIYTEPKIYPNPAYDNGTMVFDTPQSGMVTITVTDLGGKLMTRADFIVEKGRHAAYIPAMPHGMYVVSVKGAGFNAASKWICLGNNAGIAVHDVVALALTNLLAQIVVEQSEGSAAATAAIGFLHFHIVVAGIGLQELPRLGVDAKALTKVTGVVVGHVYCVVPGLHGMHAKDVHDELCHIHGLLGNVLGKIIRGIVNAMCVFGPVLLHGTSTGAAGGDNVVEVHVTEKLKVLAQIHDHGLAVAGRHCGDAAAGEIGGHVDCHVVVFEHLEAGLCHAYIVLVTHAARVEGNLETAELAGFVEIADLGVQGHVGQGADVPVANEGTKQGRIHCLLGRIILLEEDVRHRAAYAHAHIEQLGFCQHHPEDGLLDGA